MLKDLNCNTGYNRFKEDYALMLGRHPPIYFFLTWCIITPLALIVSLYV